MPPYIFGLIIEKSLIMIKKMFLSLLPLIILSHLVACEPEAKYNFTEELTTVLVEDNGFAKDTTGIVMPNQSQAKVQVLVSEILSQFHYRKVPLNDSLSSVIFDSYLESLDNNKVYFLASEIKEFEKYRNELDEDLKRGNLVPAFHIYNVFKRNFKERNKYVSKLLEKEFDYTRDETYDTDRTNEAWPANKKELNEQWRLLIKNQALNLKVSGKSWEETVKTLKDRYKNLEKSIDQYTSEEVFQLFMNSFVTAVDPHTTYFSQVASENFKIDMSRSLEGIGAQLGSDNDYTRISEIIAGGPAFKSGVLKKDDRIIGVAQGKEGEMVDVIGWRLPDVVKLIRGAKGTVVRLSVLESEGGANAMPIEVEMVRDKINLADAAAKSEVLEMEHNDKAYRLGVITLPTFYMDFDAAQRGDENYNSTTRDVKKLVLALKKENVDGIILDLRFNGGGSLTEAIDLTGLFIPGGPVVQVKNTNGSIDVGKDEDPEVVYDGPLAVLTNRFSASASEIFAGAIQDYKRGIIIGEQTFGKGTVQNLIDLDRFLPDEKRTNNKSIASSKKNGGVQVGDGEIYKPGQLKMTIAKFYRINGSSTQHRGVTPDVEFPSAFSAEEFGESAQKSALPWDQIKPTKFNVIGQVSDQEISELERKHKERLRTDPALVDLINDNKEFIKLRNETEVSLKESTRIQEREEAEKLRAARAKLSGTIGTEGTSVPEKKVNKDTYLQEGAKVLLDLIAGNIG